MTKKHELREQIERLQQHNEALAETNNSLESWRASWLNGYNEREQVTLQTTHDAVTSMFEALGVDNLTVALHRIEALLRNKDAHHAIQAVTQAKARFEDQVRVQGLAIKQVEYQRDSAQKRNEELEFDLANTKARVEELESLMREVDTEMGRFSKYASPKLAQLKTAMARMVGDEV